MPIDKLLSVVLYVKALIHKICVVFMIFLGSIELLKFTAMVDSVSMTP